MFLTKGSILNLAPADGWQAEFGTEGETWTVPVIGFATVVRWANVERKDGDPVPTIETELEAVVLSDEMHAVTVTEYKDDRSNTHLVRIFRSTP